MDFFKAFRVLRQICFVVVFLAGGLAQAGKVLVVSDIDDTLKVSHILSTMDMVLNAPKTDAPFIGTPEVLRALESSQGPGHIAYVTKAITGINDFLGHAHQNFLAQNRYPYGALTMRPSLKDDNFKFKTISKLVIAEAPTDLILIGDNGEEDSLAYRQIRERFPAVKVYSYIHLVYFSQNESEAGKLLSSQDRPWVTSLDLAIALEEDGFLTIPAVKQIAKTILPKIYQQDLHQSHGALAIPSWMDYRDYLGLAWPKPNSKYPWYNGYLQFLVERGNW